MLHGEQDLSVDLKVYNNVALLSENEATRHYLSLLENRSKLLITSGTPKPILSGTFDDRSIDYKRQYGTRLTVHNYTSKPIVTIDRVGLPVVIEPELRQSGLDKPCVLIRKEMHFDNDDVCKRVHDTLIGMGQLHCPELKELQPVLVRPGTRGRFGRKIGMEYIIREMDLDNPQEAVFHYKTDLVIAWYRPGNLPTHPSSAQYIAPLDMEVPGRPQTDDDVTVRMRYVSNNPNALPKYVRFANKTFQLTPQFEDPAKLVAVKNRDKRIKDLEYVEELEYIEFLYPSCIDTKDPKIKGHRCVRLTLEDARMYHGVFDTLAEANAPAETYENRIRLAKEKADLQDLEYRRRENEHKERVAALEKQNSDLKQEQQVKLEKIKERRESELHRQRMSFESAKFGFSVAATILGLVPVAIKIYQATKPKA